MRLLFVKESDMEKSIPLDAMTKVVEVLTSLSSEDRIRVIRAAMALLGDAQPNLSSVRGEVDGAEDLDGAGLGSLSLRARTWMKQGGVSEAELQQVFHVTEEGMQIIAAHMPGKNKKEQTYNAYILTGLGQLILTGNPTFQDRAARTLCEASGCYDAANHSATIRERGNEFTGTKDKGWTITSPGLKRAAEIIKELNRSNIGT
jgi:hypothetical protein